MISIKKLFKASWKDYKENWKLFLLIGIVFMAIGFIGNLGVSFNPHTGTTTGSGVMSLVSWVLQAIVSLGFIKLLLSMVDKKDYSFDQLFKGPKSVKHFVYFVLVSFIYSFIVGIGTLFLIIPGIVFSIGFFFVKYIIAEEKADVFESFSQSWKLTSGHRWKICWLMIVLGLFNLLGLLAFGIGLVITIPVSFIVYARLYRKLETLQHSKKEKKDEDNE